MELFANPAKPQHAMNNQIFLTIMQDYPGVKFWQPNKEKAPWHVKAVAKADGYAQHLQFWPHLLQGQRNGMRTGYGEAFIRHIIEDAIKDSYRSAEEPFDVIEEDDL